MASLEHVKVENPNLSTSNRRSVVTRAFSASTEEPHARRIGFTPSLSPLSDTIDLGLPKGCRHIITVGLDLYSAFAVFLSILVCERADYTCFRGVSF